MRLPRRLATIAAVALILVPTAAAQSGAPLPRERYTPIETALKALDALETRPTQVGLSTATAACRSLDGEDTLKRRYGALCLANLQASVVALDKLGDCDGPKDCRQAIGAVRKGIAGYVTAARRFNRVLPGEVADAACRRALDVGPEELRAYRSLDHRFALLSEALRSGSTSRIRRAERRLRSVRGIPTSAQNLRRLGKDCAPG